MDKLLKGIMLLFVIFMSLFIISLILSALSWKIYTLIYTNYAWGLLFPYAKYRSIFIFLVVILCLLILGLARIIIKIRKH